MAPKAATKTSTEIAYSTTFHTTPSPLTKVCMSALTTKEMMSMGTTIAAVRINGQHYEAAWVGDSRIYRWDNSLQRLSHDHSIVEALVEAGELTEAQARIHPQRSVLTQALGITSPDQLHIGLARGELTPGARLLLCTDGLTDEVDDRRIGEIVSRSDIAAQECVDHLLLEALGGNGRDNVTAILLRAAG